MNYKNKKIKVIYGGWSAERNISIQTGQAVLKSLIEQELDASGIDLKSLSQIDSENFDIAYIALHGEGGEDGVIQAYLNAKKIPYTGSNAKASATCMNKYLTKKILDASNIPTPAYEKLLITKADFSYLSKKYQLPFVLKAISQGSAIGVHIVNSQDEFQDALFDINKHDDMVMIEKYIKGREFTVGILGKKALPVLEITTENTFYDFDAKYSDGKSKHHEPKDLNANILDKMKDLAKKTHKKLGCKAVSRVDLMLDEAGQIFVIEINTIPGMTKTSLLPDAASKIRISFNELVLKILDASF